MFFIPHEDFSHFIQTREYRLQQEEPAHGCDNEHLK